MIKLIDLSFYAYTDHARFSQVLKSLRQSLGYAKFLNNNINTQFVKHFDSNSYETIDGIRYAGFKSRNKFWYIPFNTLRYIKREKPDIILVQGLKFPIQTIALRLFVGKRPKIIVQHHGELPLKGLKHPFSKLADMAVDAYIFTSRGNFKLWEKNNNIRKNRPCFEVLEASTNFQKQDNKLSKNKLGIKTDNNFLWVGRLDDNKDPLTVLNGFEQYLTIEPDAKLHMIYQYDGLLGKVKNTINNSTLLKNAVRLVGKVAHDELVFWFSACEFFILGSHKEGSGYALIEAMACGCIPVVTDIPSFNKITSDGRYGFLYEVGNTGSLFSVLKNLHAIDKTEMSEKIVEHFSEELSFKKIADNLYGIFRKLVTE